MLSMQKNLLNFRKVIFKLSAKTTRWHCLHSFRCIRQFKVGVVEGY